MNLPVTQFGSLRIINKPVVLVYDRPGFHNLNSGRNRVKFFLFAQTELCNVQDIRVRSEVLGPTILRLPCVTGSAAQSGYIGLEEFTASIF